MWLYPLPSLVALLGWIFIFATTPPTVIAFGLGALALGAVCFGAWSWKGRTWPFEAREGFLDGRRHTPHGSRRGMKFWE
jgi:hypothetical protein